MRLITLVTVCVAFASSAYLALDLSHPKPLELRDLTLAPKTLPRSSPPSATIEVEPSQPPVAGQRAEVTTGSESGSAVSPAPASETSLTSGESRSPASPSTESPRASRVEGAPVWTPAVTGISPDWPGNLAAEQTPSPTNIKTPENPANAPSDETQHDSATLEPIAESPTRPESAPIVMLQPSDLPAPEFSIVKSPTPSANSEPSTREKTGPEQNADHRQMVATPSPKSSGPSLTPPIVAAELDHRPLSRQQAAPAGKISLTQTQGKPRKAREIPLDRFSASLYSGNQTPPARTLPAEQKEESNAPAPPPPVDAPTKSSDRHGTGDMDVGGDLRRFAASYVREREKGDVAGQQSYYAGSVHFYGEGDLSWTRIAAATRRYQRNSGQRRYSALSANVRGPVNGGFWIVDQPYTWSKSDGTRVQTGKSVLRMKVLPSGRGHFKITSIEEVGE